MRITKNFFKYVPIEKQILVHKKLQQFSEVLTSANVFSGIPKGFWVRRIVGTSIYKFRVNSGDRVLFAFDENTQEIIFLSYETHDNQIRAAHTKRQINSEELIIDIRPYEEEAIDEQINRYALDELKAKLFTIEQQDILEDEYISFMIEKSLLDSTTVLTREQFECFVPQEKLTIIWGCAGSGKTNIAIRRLLLHHELEIPSAFISHSPFLMQSVSEHFYTLRQNTPNIHFWSLRQFYEQILGKAYTVVDAYDFVKWYEQNELAYDGLTLNAYEIFLEINSVVKGHTLEPMLQLKDYIKYASYLPMEERHHIHFVARLYKQWLQRNQYVDLNDLAYLALKAKRQPFFIIMDEMQELTYKQFVSLIHLAKQYTDILIFGDQYQVLENYQFSRTMLLETLQHYAVPYHEMVMTKNFRSGEKIVDVLNALKEQKTYCYPLSKPFKETATRESSKPFVAITEQSILELLQRLSQNPNAIAIVSSEQKCKQYRSLGFQRVFMIQDIQGLEYQEVYCLDILALSEDRIKIDSTEKRMLLFQVYFNQLYVAASRAVEKLYFIEQKSSLLLNRLQPFLTMVSYESLVPETIQSSITEWYDEGIKLKSLGKYIQAIDAFQKAQVPEQVTLCKQLLERKRNYQHLEEFESILKFAFPFTSAESLKTCLNMLDELGIRMTGKISIFVTALAGNIIYRQAYISPDLTLSQISELLFSFVDFSYAIKESLYIAGVFYQDDTPIHISKLVDGNDNDILFDNSTSYRLVTLNYEHSMKEKHHQFDKTRYSPEILETVNRFNVDALQLQQKPKEKAQDFLKDIFS